MRPRSVGTAVSFSRPVRPDRPHEPQVGETGRDNRLAVHRGAVRGGLSEKPGHSPLPTRLMRGFRSHTKRHGPTPTIYEHCQPRISDVSGHPRPWLGHKKQRLLRGTWGGKCQQEQTGPLRDKKRVGAFSHRIVYPRIAFLLYACEASLP